MKYKEILGVSFLLLSSCAYVPQKNQTAQQVSDDYLVYGSTEGIKAYLYGNHTVIEPASSPLFLWIYDGNSKNISYEKVGRYYRLNREMPTFTAWVDGSPVTFYKTKKKSQEKLIQLQPALSYSSQVIVPLAGEIKKDENGYIDDVLAITKRQNQEVRYILDAYGDKNITWFYRTRLTYLESRLTTESTITVRVPFQSSLSTKVHIDNETSEAVIQAAKKAYLVNIRGRTDSQYSNKKQRAIALKRALNVRKLLIDNGIPSEIINVYAKSSGDFVVPNLNEAGHALNRRVEIEVINPNFSLLTLKK